jgi:hypothetical protein
VKLSALAVRLEEPFRFLICSDWHRDSKNFIDGSISIVDLGKKGHFSLGTSWWFDCLLELGASPFPYCVLFSVDE